jgi:hypothetical protein
MHAPERPSGSFLRPFESRHCFGRNELVWDGLQLRLRTVRGRVMATVEEDANSPGMWRVRFGGKLSDMANLSWTKDAAISIALSELNAGRFQIGNPAYRERDKTWAEGFKID